jgi:hypothetical protein
VAEQSLTSEVAGLFGPLIPTGPIRIAVVGSVGAAVLLSAAMAPEMPLTAELVNSAPMLLGSLVQCLAFAGVVLAWPAPSAGLALTAAAMVAVGVMPTAHQGVPLVWVVPGSALAALSVVDLVSRVRRTVLAHQALAAADPMPPPTLPGDMRKALLRTGRWRVAVAVLLMVAAVGSVGWWLRDSAAVTAFRARAEEVRTTVEAVSDDWTSIDVSVQGTSIRVPTPSHEYTVGEQVTVRVDLGTGRAEVTDDVFDPSLVLLFSLPCAGLAIALIAKARRVRGQLYELLTTPQPAVRALATGAPRAGGVLVSPVDDVTAVAGIAPRLVLVVGPLIHAAWGADALDEDGHDDETDDWEAGTGDAEEPAGEPAAPGVMPSSAGQRPSIWARPDVSAMSDEQLLHRAREPIWPDPAERERFGTDAWSREPVIVSGRLDQNGPVLVRRGDETYLATSELRHPLWRSVRSGSTPAAESRTAWATFTQARNDALLRLGRATGMWLPWLLLPAVAAASRWVVSITPPSPRLLGAAFAFIVVPWVLSVTGTPVLSLRPRGLRFSSLLTDTYIPWSRVTGEAVDGDALVVRFDNGRPGGDALLLRSDPKVRRLTRDGASTTELAARIRSGRSLEPAQGRLVVLPSPALLAALAWLAAMITPAVLR